MFGRREEKVSFVDRIAAISPRRAGSTSAPAHSVGVKNEGVSAGPVSLRTLTEEDDEILDLTGEDGDEILDLTRDPDRETQVMGRVNGGNAASEQGCPEFGHNCERVSVDESDYGRWVRSFGWAGQDTY